MEVKPGYKQTEVGVIPEEWGVVALGNFISLQRGHDLTWRDRKKGDVPVMGSAGQNGFHNIAISGGPGVVLGRSGASFGQAHYCEQDFWPHNTALYVTDFRDNDRLFVFYFLNSFDFSRHNSGGAQQSLNRNFIAPINIGVPRPHEQRAIATALSDVDGLLGGLDQLIAKKRDIKQAAMQQLLTGQTRLPGLNGEWKAMRLKDVANVLKGSALSKSLVTASGNHPCILYGELFTTYGTVISQIAGYTNSSEGYTSVTGDVLMPGSTTTSGIDLATASALLLDNVALGGDILIIRQKPNAYDPVFLANYLTHSRRHQIEELTQGITIHHLYGKDLKSLSLELPSLSEQTAIAEVLTDMDVELTALEQRREKTRALKQGMMQELLTGKTRLH